MNHSGYLRRAKLGWVTIRIPWRWMISISNFKHVEYHGISLNLFKFHQENQKTTSVLDGQSPPPTGPTSRPENPGNWHRVTFHDPVALRQLENIGTYPYVLPLESIRYRSIWPETTVRKHFSKLKDRFLMFWVHVVTCLIPWHSRYM